MGFQYNFCMTVSSVTSSDEVYCGVKIDEDLRGIEQLAQKTQSIWAQVYDATIGNLIKVIHIIRRAIGTVIRDAFVFPLKWPLFTNLQSIRAQLQIEEDYCRDFWDPAKPLDPNFKDQALIREKFAPPEDRIFPVMLKDGSTVEITCRIIETKAEGESYYNFVQVPGIYTTINNNIGAAYSYLAAYLNAAEEGKSLPPARFIIISENNLNYKPANLDEAGYILLQTLRGLREEFGDIDQVVAHSLGNVFFANALSQVEDVKDLPKHICLDRGPTSAYEVSKKYFWGFGFLIYFLAEIGEWASNTEQEVVEFCEKWKERPPILITGVEQDHYFSGSANLCSGKKIKKVEGIDIMVFNPPLQVMHQHEHHNLRPDYFNPRYLIGETDFMKSTENLPEAIIRHSLFFSDPLRTVAQELR
jgi:hypothetical protein